MDLVNHAQRQEKVNAYFRSKSSHWKDVYSIGGVQAEIIRDRHEAVLGWVDSLALASGSQILEIGCGAGVMAVALAQRGCHVHAIDSAQAMVELARQHATETGTSEMLSLSIGDVHALAFEDEAFDLVIAIGVIPWLERAELAMQEMARVTKPDGHIIFTTANWAGLASILDPVVNPPLAPLKQRAKAMLERAGVLHHHPPGMTFHRRSYIDKALARLDLVKVGGMTRGFGFSFFRLSIFPEPLGTRLHQRLQRLADRNVPVLRSTGMAYLVLARKSVSQLQSTNREKPVSGSTRAL